MASWSACFRREARSWGAAEVHEPWAEGPATVDLLEAMQQLDNPYDKRPQ